MASLFPLAYAVALRCSMGEPHRLFKLNPRPKRSPRTTCWFSRKMSRLALPRPCVGAHSDKRIFFRKPTPVVLGEDFRPALFGPGILCAQNTWSGAGMKSLQTNSILISILNLIQKFFDQRIFGDGRLLLLPILPHHKIRAAHFLIPHHQHIRSLQLFGIANFFID